MTQRERLAVTADLLAAGYEPDEIGLRELVIHEVRQLVARAVDFELVSINLDRPNADKYGTHADGTPRYAPEWYAAHGIKTGINEGLHGAVSAVLECQAEDDAGHRCIGSLLHENWHHDGNGHNWADASSSAS